MKYKKNSLLGICVFDKLNALELSPAGKLIYGVMTVVMLEGTSIKLSITKSDSIGSIQCGAF